MSTHIIMPEMGEGVIEGTIVRWLKREGETVRRDDPILEIETDKVTVEVAAESSGTLLKVAVDEGETVSVGTVLAVIGEPDEDISSMDEPVQAAVSAAHKSKPGHPVEAGTNNVHAPAAARSISRVFDGVRVSPVVARMLQAHDIDIHDLSGSGRDGRITKNDVLSYLDAQEKHRAAPVEKRVEAQRAAPLPEQTRETRAETLAAGDELLPLTGIRRAIAEHMVRSKHTSPHAATVFEFDFTAVAQHRATHKDQFERDGAKLTYLPYIVLATVQALKKHPMVNACWTDDGILLKREINLGIAVAVPNGLIVPVIRHADGMNLLGLARAIHDLSERARNNQLKPDEVKGGTFTISNHGVSGSLIGMPIINQPQVGILGLGKIEKRVKVINDAIAIRLCAYISFSFDHRILDGAAADAFMTDIQQAVEHYS